MFRFFLLLSLICTNCCLLAKQAAAQSRSNEEAEIAIQGKRYLDLNIRSLTKYESRIARKQQVLLARLKKKEHRFAKRLKDKDSLAWSQYQQKQLSYDSISSLTRVDSSAQITKLASKPNAVIDSLKGVTRFIDKTEATAGMVAGSAGVAGYDKVLSSLNGKLNYRAYINDLITQRTEELKTISNGKIAGISGFEQQVFYAKAQMKVYKGLAEDPGRLEEKAYEYLQGVAGFDEGIDKAVNGSGLLSAAGNNALSAGDLERMGFQTKRQLNTALQQKLGGNMSAVKEQLGSQVASWQKDAQKLTSQVQDTRHSIAAIKSTARPSFKINPMRCLPFWQRIEKSYDFQTSRATADGKPAMLQLGAMAAYRQTPKLSAGLGIAASFGLGQSWSQIHLSFEGVGFRSFVAWQLVYGIGAYAGYERTYKRMAFMRHSEEAAIIPSVHNTTTYSECALLGLSKSYKINSKANGAVQLLYDFWWKEKALNSPIIIRFSTN